MADCTEPHFAQGRCKKHYEKQRHLLSTYGLSWEEFESMAESQEGKCPICKSPLLLQGMWATHVDHCHSTGTVRALLCHPCNVALGMLEDDPVRIRRAADYIESFF